MTGVWNWAVRKIEQDAKFGIYYKRTEFKALLNGHSRRMGIPAEVLIGAADHAWMTWKACRAKGAGRPRLKGRRNKLNSLLLAHGVTRAGGRLSPRVFAMPMRFHRQDVPDGHIGSARLSCRASGWYLTLFVQAEPKSVPLVSDGAVGIDPGFTRLLTLSTGEIVEHPHELRAGAARLAQAQRGRRGRLVARLHERQANRRRDRNHKLSRRLVSENALIAWSSDSTRAIARTMGKSVAGAAHYQLRQMLAYKSRAGGRRFVEVPSRRSTMTCSACRALTGPTGYAGLSVRQWVCGHCGSVHDRDVNAALNTLAGAGIALERRREAATGIVTVKQHDEVQSQE